MSFRSDFQWVIRIIVCSMLFQMITMHHRCMAANVIDEATDTAVREIGETTWFDPEKQTLVPVPMQPQQRDTIHRDSRWLPGAKKIPKNSNTPNQNAPGWFNTNLTTGNLVGWGILAFLFFAVAALVLYAFSKVDPEVLSIQRRGRQHDGDHVNEQTLKRMEELPAGLRQMGHDLRSEAEKWMTAGQFDEAIKCLFGHQLLILDRGGLIRLSRGKTNGRYVSETKATNANAADLLRTTVAAFEASYFGRRPPTAASFSDLWAANQRLESMSIPTPGSST
jgi:hypothetical protein